LPDADIRVLRRQVAAVPEGATGCLTNLEQAVNFAPQVAVIANPASLHVSVAHPLAEAGVHLLIEKPLSASSDGVLQFLRICKARGVTLLLGYNLRFLPSLLRFHDLVKQGLIGRVLSVRCEVGQFLPAWRPGTDYRKGASSQRALGGGALLELSHELDYLRWIFGEIDSVKATLSRQSDFEIDVEDTAHLILHFAPSADGHRLLGTLNIDFVRHDTTRTCVAIGDKGSLRWNGLSGIVDSFKANGNTWNELFRYQHMRDESYLAEWRHFLDCVKEQKSPMITGEDGLRILNIVDAARQATEFGGLVHVEQVGITRRKVV